MDKLLEIKSLKSWYGASQALFDVNLEINKVKLLPYLAETGWESLPLLNLFVV